MKFESFVEIVLQHADGYSSPCQSEIGKEICMSDHNYTNLTPLSHNKKLEKNNRFKGAYNASYYSNRYSRGLWHRNRVLRLSEETGSTHNEIYICDEEEGEGRKMKRGEEVRKMHNTLEKKRRATQRKLMEGLRTCLPGSKESTRRWSQHLIINSAISHISKLSMDDVQIQRQVSHLRRVEADLIGNLRELNDHPRSASHLSSDSGADSGIINSDDDDQDLQVA